LKATVMAKFKCELKNVGVNTLVDNSSSVYIFI